MENGNATSGGTRLSVDRSCSAVALGGGSERERYWAELVKILGPKVSAAMDEAFLKVLLRPKPTP